MKTDNAHARLAAAIRGQRYTTLEEDIEEAKKRRTAAAARDLHERRDDAPDNAHALLAEALGAEPAAPAGQHQRLAKAFGAAR